MHETRRRFFGTLAIGVTSVVTGCFAQEESGAEPTVSISVEFDGAIDRDGDGSGIGDIRVNFEEVYLDWVGLDGAVSAILLGVDTEYGRLMETAYEGSWPATGELRGEPGEYSLLERTEATADDLVESGSATLDLEVVVQLYDGDEGRLLSARSEETLSYPVSESEVTTRRVLIAVMDLYSSRLEDATVRAYEEGHRGTIIAETETDEEGRARLQLVDGAYIIAVDHEDHRGATLSIDLRGDGESLVFMLEPEGGDEDEDRGRGNDGRPGDDDSGESGEDDEEGGGDENGEDDDGDGFIFDLTLIEGDGHDGI